MIQLRKAGGRGYADHGWLKSYHTFSFAGYQDPQHTGFAHLRVINEDRVEGGKGFGTHPHQDMEIVTYVLQGALEHQDSMGNGSVIHPGEIQVVSAGTGVTHSEYNHSQSEIAHFYQIWVVPDRSGYEPRYQQKDFSPDFEDGRLVLLASEDGRKGSLSIRQNVDLYAAKFFREFSRLTLTIRSGQPCWIQILAGSGRIGEYRFDQGDGISLREEHSLELEAHAGVELLMFEFAA